MGMLIEGQWIEDDAKYRNAAGGEYVRADSQFRHSVRADGSSPYLPQSGRYQLLVAANCPWAHRTAITRRLKGLEAAVEIIYSVGPQDGQGWQFDRGVSNGPSPTPSATMALHEVYTAAQPSYSGRVTVPTLWDIERAEVVNNESAEIVRMFDTEFASCGADGPPLRPPELIPTIDEVNEWVYRDINNGVYRCGFAQTQSAYEQACTALFAALDRAEALLDRHRYLAGDVLSEADVRLFPTLVRFDLVYYGLFKCNLRHLWDYPNLSAYVRDLYAEPGFGETCDLAAFKRGYYAGIGRVNPNRIVPLGPTVDFTGTHDRASRHYTG